MPLMGYAEPVIPENVGGKNVPKSNQIVSFMLWCDQLQNSGPIQRGYSEMPQMR